MNPVMHHVDDDKEHLFEADALRNKEIIVKIFFNVKI